MLSSVGLKKINHTFSNFERGGGGGAGVLPRKILKNNNAREAISGHFLRAILPSVNKQFQKILLPFILYALFKYKINKDMHMSVFVLCVDTNDNLRR